MQLYDVFCPSGYEIIIDITELGMKDAGTMDIEEFYNLPITIKYNGEIVTENVPSVEFIGSPMRINKSTLYVSTGSSSSEYYDDIVLTNETVNITKGKLAEGHKLIAKTNGVQTEVGKSSNTIETETFCIIDEDGNNVTSNYSVKLELGVLEITESSN